ncbi:MAG: outer membrane lipoprotein carrier protein LolA [Burkholderiales bacterium]|nr:outer membrane lipoprotein carrier protein LolA [Burkholderiales bacterium]
MRIPEKIAAFLLLALVSWCAHADDLKIGKLMHLLAKNKAGKATFVEKKYIGVLEKPLESTGTLSFEAPDRLEKRTLTPKPEALLLEGKTLTIERPGKKRTTVNLDEHPEVAAFIESIRGTLAGDLSSLEANYEVGLSGSMDHWQLSLKPRQARLSGIFSRILISGTGPDVRTIELDQEDGDHSEMSIKQADVAR